MAGDSPKLNTDNNLPETKIGQKIVTALPGSRDFIEQVENVMGPQQTSDSPTVHFSSGPEIITTSEDKTKKNKTFSPFVYLIIVLLLVGGGFFWYRALQERGLVPGIIKPEIPAVIKAETSPKFSLSTSKKEYMVGEMIPVNIKINTAQNRTIAADVILNYDPSVVSTVTPLISQNFKQGKIFEDYPSVVNNPVLGIFQASAINSLDKPGFKGEGVFGVLNLQANAVGTTTIRFNFIKDERTDSNLLSEADSVDILEQVEDLTITVR